MKPTPEPHAESRAASIVAAAIASLVVVSSIGALEPARQTVHCKRHDVRHACVVETQRWWP